MESQPQNAKFRNNPETFHSCRMNTTVECSVEFNLVTLFVMFDCILFFRPYQYLSL